MPALTCEQAVIPITDAFALAGAGIKVAAAVRAAAARKESFMVGRQWGRQPLNTFIMSLPLGNGNPPNGGSSEKLLSGLVLDPGTLPAI